MIGAVDPLEPIAVGLAVVEGVVIAWHLRRRHRRVRRAFRAEHRAIERDAMADGVILSPDASHPFVGEVGHTCLCGRGAGHDVHHRVGGEG